MRKVKIMKETEKGNKEVPLELMAKAITDISTGIKQLRSGPLNEKCLLLLI